jgi:hypothetical protein
MAPACTTRWCLATRRFEASRRRPQRMPPPEPTSAIPGGRLRLLRETSGHDSLGSSQAHNRRGGCERGFGADVRPPSPQRCCLRRPRTCCPHYHHASAQRQGGRTGATRSTCPRRAYQQLSLAVQPAAARLTAGRRALRRLVKLDPAATGAGATCGLENLKREKSVHKQSRDAGGAARPAPDLSSPASPASTGLGHGVCLVPCRRLAESGEGRVSAVAAGPSKAACRRMRLCAAGRRERARRRSAGP